MIFRRQLITAATAIITLTVLLASTDVSVPPGSIALWLTLVSMLQAAHIEDTVVPESTDSMRLVEETNGGWDFTHKACKQLKLSIDTKGTCNMFDGCDASRNSHCTGGKCECRGGPISGTNNVWCSTSKGKCESVTRRGF